MVQGSRMPYLRQYSYEFNIMGKLIRGHRSEQQKVDLLLRTEMLEVVTRIEKAILFKTNKYQ